MKINSRNVYNRLVIILVLVVIVKRNEFYTFSLFCFVFIFTISLVDTTRRVRWWMLSCLSVSSLRNYVLLLLLFFLYCFVFIFSISLVDTTRRVRYWMLSCLSVSSLRNMFYCFYYSFYIVLFWFSPFHLLTLRDELRSECYRVCLFPLFVLMPRSRRVMHLLHSFCPYQKRRRKNKTCVHHRIA